MHLHSPTINLVCTRCTDGNHIALQRWYADHVHLLLAAPELQQAQLFRCTQPLTGQPPDYICMYAFASVEAFEAFEHGQPKQQATELTNTAAGRSSIEIVQRAQYARKLHRQWPAPSSPGSPNWGLVACLQSASSWTLATERWLADQLQALRACTPLIAAQAYVHASVQARARLGEQRDQTTSCFIVLDFAGGDAQSIWLLLQDQLAQSALYGQAPPSLRFDWAATASWQQSWLR